MSVNYFKTQFVARFFSRLRRDQSDSFEKGQTLVEAIVALGVAVILIVALVAATTMSLSRSQFIKDRALAQKYAEEAIEWARAERDADWDDFANQAPLDNPRTYCLNVSPIANWTIDSSCSYTLDATFKREVLLTRTTSNPNRVEAKVTVSWQEGGRNHNSEQVTYFTRY